MLLLYRLFPIGMKKIQAIDLFCGAGGLTCGLQKAGINVRAGIDVDGKCEYAFSHNNKAKFLARSILDVNGEELRKLLSSDDYTLLAGCAPCQAFSNYNRKANETDSRWTLLLEFGRLIDETRPTFVTMENVPQLAQKGKGVFQRFLLILKNLGYWVDWKVIQCEEYGLPQKRKRLVLVGSKLGKIKILASDEFGFKPKTVREAIAFLKPISAGEMSATDPLHKSCKLSPLNLQRIRASKPGGTWRDWPESLRSTCHKKVSGRSYQSVYGRMSWDEPSPTITTQFVGYGTGRFGHPEQDRAISLREGALLQSFPLSYEFVPPGEKVDLFPIARMIGNAVPVVIGELIGKTFVEHLLCHFNSQVNEDEK